MIQSTGSKDEVKVGIVGAKFAAKLHAESYGRVPEANVLAIADIDDEALENFTNSYDVPTTYSDYTEMFENEHLDLVSVCVPNFLHSEVTIKAAEAGMDIVCEKPLATTVEDAEEMVEIASRNDVRLMYAEDWVFAPALVRAKEILTEGAIGDLLYMRAKESHSGSHSVYAKKEKYCGGGTMIHLGIHPLGFALSLLGNDIESVTGARTGGLDDNLYHEDFEGEDWGIGILRYSSGQIAQVEANYVTQGGMDDVVEMFGTDGVIKVDLTQGSPLRVFSQKGLNYTVEKAKVKTGWSFPAVDEYSSLGYQGEIEHFVNCALGRTELKEGVQGRDGLKVVETVKEIYRAGDFGDGKNTSGGSNEY